MQQDEPPSPTMLTATHLFVLQHGLHGSANDFTNFVRLMREHLAPLGVYVHSATSNAASFFQTYDGIDEGGVRLANEIEALAARMPQLTKLSMLGHSLGGLYNRFCIGVLFARGFFARIKPVNFITMATPHMGIRRPQRGSVNFMYNSITKKLFHRTGQQFFLADSANELTHELSMNAVATQLESNAQPAVRTDRTGTLLICTDAVGGDGELYEYYYCVLRDQMLQLFDAESHSVETSNGPTAASVLEIDLRRADVTLALPPRPVASRSFASTVSSTSTASSGNSSSKARPKRSGSGFSSLYSGLLSLTTRRSRSNSSVSQQSGASSGRPSDPDGSDSPTHEPYEVTITWTSTVPSDRGKQRRCVVRIAAEEIDRDWPWLSALSNHALGVRCITPTTTTSRSDVDAKRDAEAVHAPPLLCCMARGQFVHALQLFATRTLYANVFFDLQVPYSCAAIRAFNPYRMETTQRATSPVYPHITLVSLASAALVRDTLSAEVRVQLASKRGPVRFFSQDGHRKRLSLTGTIGGTGTIGIGTSASQSLPTNFETTRSSSGGGDVGDDDDPNDPHSSGSADHRHTVMDETEFTRRSMATSTGSFSGDGSRADPFVAGDVILDRVHEAFTSDSERDALRGMLVSLQSVGWRRIDVVFDNVLAHERIIAKRANPNKMAESGLDLVYHVMNVFVV